MRRHCLLLCLALAATLAAADTQQKAAPQPQKPAAQKAGQQKPAPKKPSEQEILQEHYDAARTFQLSGDNDHAAAEYTAFLAGALRTISRASVGMGDSARAGALLDDVLVVAPNDMESRLDWAQLQFQQQKLPEAKAAVEKVLATSPDNARAHSLLGQILFAQDDYRGAKEQLEAAVVAAPSFDVAYLLGITYIKLNDFSRARLVFDDLVGGFGDTPQIHLMFGRAYREGGWEALDLAIQELKKAIAKNEKMQHAHFLIALAYLDRDGETGFPAAAAELQAELKVSPEDARSYYLLGYIAMKQHDTKTAEEYLLRSSHLDPKNPDPLIYLGQIYSDAGKDQEAEAMLRKAIELSGNASKNDYLIGRAHYVLGRLLLKQGKREEGEKELVASQTIRDQMNRPGAAKDSKSKSDPELASAAEAPAVATPGMPQLPPAMRPQVQAYIEQLKPAIADAYNNLGVINAGKKDFAAAAADFRKAGEWNPTLQTVDRNWGMAAFYGGKYDEAVGPLTRHLEKHPDDTRVRSALALSLFSMEKYKETVETLKPIEGQLSEDAGLASAYGSSLVNLGEYDEGMRRLKEVAAANPDSPEVHAMLGSAYAGQHEYDTAAGEFRKSLAIDANQPQTHYQLGLALIESGKPQEAVDELRAALKANPADTAAKYHLAFALIQVQQKPEAETLLREVIEQDPSRADAYYELGKLELEHGDTKAAVASFENGVKANPDADYIHYQLAMAYRRDARTEDAEREIKVYQTLKNRQRGRGDAPESN
jgi:tetratricopeptide (TPR) repeat protein